jgi:hypothetical protein
VAGPVDRMGTASVDPVMAPPVPGVQKLPRQVGKRFWGLAAAPEGKVKIPVDLKTRPAWLRQDRLGANPVVCRGNAGCQAQRLLPYRP